MRSRNYSLPVIGLLALGLLILNHAMPWEPPEAQAVGEPLIQFVEPAGAPRYMDPDPGEIDQIDIPVEVSFPPAAAACAGAPLPVIASTMEVTVTRQLDGAVLDSWPVVTSGWTWNAEENNVTGQVTIGGVGSGQERSLYGIKVCISNGSASACATKGIRVEHPVSDLAGGAFFAKANSFTQSTGCGLIDPGFIPIINGMMADTVFGVIVPSAAQIPGQTVNFSGIPLIGSINMTASLNAGTNNVDLAEVEVSGIDLGGIKGLPAGYNCAITGFGDGLLLGPVSPGLDVDGEIRIYGMTLEDGSGSGACTRNATGCELLIKFDGNPP